MLRTALPRHALSALLAALCFAGCQEPPRDVREWRASDHAHPPGAPDPERVARQVPGTPSEQPPADPAEAAARAGATLWQVACASCHGRTGVGDGPSRAPVMRLPNFQDPTWHEENADDEAIIAVIALGRGMMPGFRDRIPADGLRALVGHIRGFRPAAADAPSDEGEGEGEGESTEAVEAEPPEAGAAEPSEASASDPSEAGAAEPSEAGATEPSETPAAE